MSLIASDQGGALPFLEYAGIICQKPFFKDNLSPKNSFRISIFSQSLRFDYLLALEQIAIFKIWCPIMQREDNVRSEY